MPIVGVAFDLEGTIIDVEDVHFDAFVESAHRHKIAVSFEEIVGKIPNAIGGGDRLIAEGISKLSGERVSAESILVEKQTIYDSILSERIEIPVRRGFYQVFEQILSRGLRVAIGSLTPSNQAQVLLDRSGLKHYFDMTVVVLREHVRNPKPAPDVFLETSRRMNIVPTEQLIFEDSATGLQAAHSAGSLAVALPIYKHEENIIALQTAGALKIYEDWEQVDIPALFSDLDRVID